MTGPTRGTTRGTAADELAAAELEAEQRLAEAHEAGRVATTRPGWAPLPRRAGLKPSLSPLLSLRTPISSRARWTLGVLSFLIPLTAWTVLSLTGSVDATFLPPPGAVLKAVVDMATTGELFDDAWATIQRILEGFGLAILVSVPLGILMGTFDAGQAFLEPVIALLRYLPAVALIPLLMIWLGVDEGPKIALVFFATLFFNIVMTADVVRQVPQATINVSYTLGARRNEVLRKVIVPHATPGMIDAVRVNVAAAWNLVVASELLAATAGLGYRIIRSQRFLQTDKIFAVLVVIGLVGLVIDVLLRILRSRVGKWTA